jgi:methyl-accepting chemotaxis protein
VCVFNNIVAATEYNIIEVKGGIAMKWFRNLSTMLKILLLVGVMVVLMLVVSYTGYTTSDRIAQRMNEMYDDYAKIALNISEAKYLAASNRRIILSMAILEEPSELDTYQNHVLEYRQKIADLIGNLDEGTMTPEAIKTYERLEQIGPEYRKKQDEAMAIAKSGVGLDELQNRMLSKGDIGTIDNDYIDGLEHLAGMMADQADSMSDGAIAFARQRAVTIAIISGSAMLFGILLSVIISRTITVPVAKMLSSIKLFSEGDLASKFPEEGRDELGIMGRELQKMSENLKNIIGSVKEASNEIMGTSQKFSDLAQETNASVGEVRTNVDETGESLTVLASTGEEVNASVEEVAAGAQATAEKGTDIARKVDEAMKAGESGMSQVRRALSGIEGVVDNASSTVKSVQELGERTQQIQNFVSEIGGIADQTNLLALNAAIEAARAGETGRGFAVVAEEVRKLAEESNLAAKSIEDLAKTIMGDLNTVVTMSLDNAKASENAKALSKETEEIIGSIITFLKDIAGATEDLAAVSQEQAASSGEIAEAIQSISTKVHGAAEAGENIRGGIGEVAVAAERMASSAEGLSHLVDNLGRMLEFFKMEAFTLGKNDKNKLALKN